MPECGTTKKYGVKAGATLLSLGFNYMTEQLGLGPIPLTNGDSLDINPGFVLKQEFNNLCKDGASQSIFPLDLSHLSKTGQSLLIDRMTELGGKATDKPLGFAGKRFESPSVPLSDIPVLSHFDLPGDASVVLWYNPKMDFTNPKVTDLNAVMVKWKVGF